MKIKTVLYQKTFNLGNYCSEKIGVEMELDEHDSADDVFESAKAFVESCHVPMPDVNISSVWERMQLPETELTTSNTPLQEIQVEKPQSTEEKIIQQINECSDVTVLKSFYLLIKNNDTIADAYSRKLKQLQP